jgi:16S rRNA (cytosine967-C5)-methyltransferase
MTPQARLAAAIEIMGLWREGLGPADRIVETWGRNHRYAGSKDRSAIAERVFSTFRRYGDIADYMGDDRPRALILGGLRVVDGLTSSDIAALCSGAYGPAPLSDDEGQTLARDCTGHGLNLPLWLEPMARASLGPALEAEMTALSARAPVDLRVNRLKATRTEAKGRLVAEGIETEFCPISPDGLRLDRPRKLDALDLVQEGWLEPQDEGSQIASLLVDARPGHRVLDLCAGAGGKSLALAAIMQNSGEIHADDSDRRRLSKLDARAYRAGARNIRVTPPHGLYDRVVVDAPCSGSGTWRRSPDARFRLTPSQLDQWRLAQTSLLARAADLVRPQGRLIYITCSWLKSENSDQVEAYLSQRPDFQALDGAKIYAEVMGKPLPDGAQAGHSVALSTARHGTDGFFVAILSRMKDHD